MSSSQLVMSSCRFDMSSCLPVVLPCLFRGYPKIFDWTLDWTSDSGKKITLESCRKNFVKKEREIMFLWSDTPDGRP